MAPGIRLPLMSVSNSCGIIALFWLLPVFSFATITNLMLLKWKDVISTASTCLVSSVVCSTSCTAFFLLFMSDLPAASVLLHIGLKAFALPHPTQVFHMLALSWWMDRTTIFAFFVSLMCYNHNPSDWHPTPKSYHNHPIAWL